MKRHLTISIILISILFISVLAIWRHSNREPKYKEKPRSYWLSQIFQTATQYEDIRTTYKALRALGPSVAPPLIQAMANTNNSYDLRQNSFAALEQINKLASNQVPQLMQLSKYSDRQGRIDAILVLADIGPYAKQAIPFLMEESTTSDTNFLPYLSEALKQIEK